MTMRKPEKLTRREFVQTSAALAAVPLIPGALLGSAPVHVSGSDKVKVGLIGCGGRGSGAATQAMDADEGVVITAMGDAFRDRLNSSHENLTKHSESQMQVDEDHKFVGFDAYQRVIASGVDVIILATPPGFRPFHLEAAIDAGKHVFCEKPMAVDAPGVRRVLAVAKKAAEKKLSLVSGFCWRYSTPERATMEQIHNGAIGDIRSLYTTYLTGPIGGHPRKPEWTDMEFQLRNWHHFNWLSGDHIVEQAVHSLDKMMWAMNGELPVDAVAVGGRQAREGETTGQSWDHFSITYQFASGAKGFHMCRQIPSCAFENNDTIMGSKGVCDINGWAPKHTIKGENNWRFQGDRNDMYQQEHDELFASIRAGEPMNNGEWMAHSTMVAIMGRMAAYTGQVIKWDQAMASTEDLTPASYAWGELPYPAVAIPGKTKFL